MSNPASIATANALSGEKTFRTLDLPVTGDCETDAILGCLEVLKSACEPSPYIMVLNDAAKVRVLEYLLGRAKTTLAESQRFQAIGQGYASDRVAAHPIAGSPPPYVHPQDYFQPGPYTTSGGTFQGLGSNAAAQSNCAWGLDPSKQKITFKELCEEINKASQPIDP